MRLDGQKAVTTYPFTADNTFKQARVTSGINPAKCGYRRQRIAQDPAKYGYGIIFAGQLDELLLIWIVTHRWMLLVNARDFHQEVMQKNSRMNVAKLSTCVDNRQQ